MSEPMVDDEVGGEPRVVPDPRDHLRRELLRILEEGEPRPEGLPPGGGDETDASPDLHALLSELVAIRREVGLQGRSLHDLAREMRSRVTPEPGGDDPALTALCDAHDAVASLVESSARRASGAGWVTRLLARERLDACVESARIVERKLRRRLDDLAVEAFATAGDAFDPATMRAIDTGEGGEDGTVLEVHRRGYRSSRRILRTAEVKVCRVIGGVRA